MPKRTNILTSYGLLKKLYNKKKPIKNKILDRFYNSENKFYIFAFSALYSAVISNALYTFKSVFATSTFLGSNSIAF